MTSFRYDVTGDIIYIWALTLTPTKIRYPQQPMRENMVPPLILPIHT